MPTRGAGGPTAPKSAHYRPDIDGLRALSVSTVIIFHAGLPILPGGFTAVEIFFVISGFLITQILVRDHEKARFSILDFYVRRIRRILPALFVVLLGTAAAGCLFLLPSELVRLGGGITATALFASNILFWDQTNYFAAEAIGQPLLHTWTLAVEEQFYIVWPVLIALVFRLGLQRTLRWLVIAGVVVSLVAAEAMAHYSPRTAFYMFPLRAWELLLGALLACWRIPLPSARWLREAIGAVGLALIVVPMLAFEETMVFPGLSALPTCLGTATLIYIGAAPGGSAVSRTLALRPFVWVGLISYSLYLVHWPIISMLALNSNEVLTQYNAVIAIAASLAFGWLAWRYVELPLRTPSPAPMANGVRAPVRGITPMATVLAGLASIAVCCLVGMVLVRSDGLPGRLSPLAARIDRFHQPQPYAKLDCRVEQTAPDDLAGCVFRNDPDRRAATLLWGDSHTLHFVNFFRDSYAARREDLLIASASGCTPLPGVLSVFGNGRSDPRCRTFNDGMLSLIESNPQIRRVIISAHWGAFHTPSALQPGRGPNMRYLLDGRSDARTAENSLRVFGDAMQRLAAALEAHGVQLVLIGSTPVYHGHVPQCFARALWLHRGAAACTLRKDEVAAERRDTEPVLVDLARRYPNVIYYDPLPGLCPGGTCRGVARQTVLTWDSHHVSDAGSRVAMKGLRLAPVTSLPARGEIGPERNNARDRNTGE